MTVIVTQDGEEAPVISLPAEPVSIIKAFAKICKILALLSPEQRARLILALQHLYNAENKPAAPDRDEGHV